MASSRSCICKKEEAEKFQQRHVVYEFSKKSRSASQVIIHDEQDFFSGINGWEAVREEQVVREWY